MKHLLNLFFSNSTALPSLSSTKQLHSHLVTSSSLSHRVHLLVNSYVAHNDLLSARTLFHQTQTRQPAILYNSLIRSHARTRQFSHAFSLFARLLRSATQPDSFTFATVIRACADNSDPNGLRSIHALLLSSGFGSDLIPVTTLISSYSKLVLLDDAVRVFEEMPQPDLVLYNSLLSGFGYGGLWQKGLGLLHRMRQCGEDPDGFTFVGLISCFWEPDSFQIAGGVHGLVFKYGFESNDHVRSVLVSMYSRLNFAESGYRVFREISCPDLVTWSAVITGFIEVDQGNEALHLFREMNDGLIKRADCILISSILSGCASMAAIGPGKEIHCYVLRVGMDSDIGVSCSLIDFYSKCGFPLMGIQVFNMISDKSSVTYNATISGLGYNGLGWEAIRTFDKMLVDGFKPDKTTFSAVLCACAHSGLLDAGSRLFARMRDEFGLKPEMEHYVYMVKLMGLVGRLDEAYELIEGMPELMGSSSGVWGALLWGCGLHGRSDLAEIAGRKLFEINPEKGAYRVMLSNVYASGEKWEEVECLREEMKGEKVIGLSWI